jgi:hypothetical protein
MEYPNQPLVNLNERVLEGISLMRQAVMYGLSAEWRLWRS